MSSSLYDLRRSSVGGRGISRFGSWISAAGRYAVLLEIGAVIVICNSLLRIAMLVWFNEPPGLSVSEWFRVLLVGFRFDVLVTLISAVPQLLILTLIQNPRSMGRFSRVCLELQWILGYVAVFTIIVAEWMFFDEFRSRLNYIAFEYLVYPTEVCCNIWESYQTGKMITVVVLLGGITYAMLRERYLRRLQDSMPATRRWSIVAVTLSIITSLWFASPISSTQVTANRTANECAGNGVYNFFYYAWTCRFDYDEFYLTIPMEEATARVRVPLESQDSDFVPNSAHPLDRIVTTNREQRNANVVLILEESLGSDFIGALGDPRGLSPEFDKLCQEGLLFNNWYATGNRTARALEAVTTSLPPLPTESILKRDHSTNVFTLAHVLAERGYERLFVTGGRGIFDGVRSFMTANGFNHFVEQGDFSNPLFKNAWGVSDEDMFHRAIDELDKLHQSGRPFFATLLTVSNHRPFTYPAGRIDSVVQSRDNAVRYADWALGDFFREVCKKDFYKDTIFIVMGDHGARVYGSQLFPIRSYRVPVLVIDPEKPGASECNTLASSLDIAPTIMGLLGGSYRSVFFGREVLSLDPEKGYAIMQHNHELALLDAHNHLTVLSSRKRSFNFDVDPVTFQLIPKEAVKNNDDAANLSAVFQTANRLYYNDGCHPDAAISATRIATSKKAEF